MKRAGRSPESCDRNRADQYNAIGIAGLSAAPPGLGALTADAFSVGLSMVSMRPPSHWLPFATAPGTIGHRDSTASTTAAVPFTMPSAILPRRSGCSADRPIASVPFATALAAKPAAEPAASTTADVAFPIAPGAARAASTIPPPTALVAFPMLLAIPANLGASARARRYCNGY